MIRKQWLHCTLVIFTGILISSRAHSDVLPDLSGRYVGSSISSLVLGATLMEVPAWSPIARDQRRYDLGRKIGYALKVQIVDVDSPSGRPTGLVIENRGRGEFQFRSALPGFEARALKWDRHASCLRERGTEEVEICLREGSITLRVGSFRYVFVKSDALPSRTVQAGASYSIAQLVGRAKYFNYTVSQEAEKVFRAREQVRDARAAILPRLRLGTLVAAVTSGSVGGAVVTAAGDLVPFLFPSNWYRLREAQSLSSAETKAFASLRGNEMLEVEAMVYSIKRDQEVAAALQEHISWMEQTGRMLLAAETVGAIPRGVAGYFQTTLTPYRSDLSAFQSLIVEELSALAHGTALDPIAGIQSIDPVEVIDPGVVPSINPSSLASAAVQGSWEIAALSELRKAAVLMRREVIWSVLDPNSSTGLSFGYGAELRIAKSEIDSIDKQIVEMKSLITGRAVGLAASGALIQRQAILTAQDSRRLLNRHSWLIQRMLLGDPTFDLETFISELSTLQSQIFGSKVEQLNVAFEWLIINAKSKRLSLKGFYSDLMAGMPLTGDQLAAFDPLISLK